MKLINFVFLLIQIFLETKIIPELPEGYINPKKFVFLGSTLCAFFITMELIKFSKLTTFCVLTLDILLGAYLIGQYYPEKPQFDIPLFLFIYYLTFFSLFFIKKENFSEMFESNIISALFKFLCSICGSNLFVNYFKLYHKESIDNFEFNKQFLTNYSEKFFVDFVVLFGSVTLCDLINFYYSKEENASRIKNIIKRIIFKFIICLVFFMILNTNLAELCYNLLFNNLSKPYNILIYNIIAYNPLIRMKVSYSVINYLFF
jgi:hypothetical protein